MDFIFIWRTGGLAQLLLYESVTREFKRSVSLILGGIYLLLTNYSITGGQKTVLALSPSSCVGELPALPAASCAGAGAGAVAAAVEGSPSLREGGSFLAPGQPLPGCTSSNRLPSLNR